MTGIAQTIMIVAALALLVYIAVIATGIYTTQSVKVCHWQGHRVDTHRCWKR